MLNELTFLISFIIFQQHLDFNLRTEALIVPNPSFEFHADKYFEIDIGLETRFKYIFSDHFYRNKGDDNEERINNKLYLSIGSGLYSAFFGPISMFYLYKTKSETADNIDYDIRFHPRLPLAITLGYEKIISENWRFKIDIMEDIFFYEHCRPEGQPNQTCTYYHYQLSWPIFNIGFSYNIWSSKKHVK